MLSQTFLTFSSLHMDKVSSAHLLQSHSVWQTRGHDHPKVFQNWMQLVHYQYQYPLYISLGSVNVVDTNLACVYSDHLIDWLEIIHCICY